MLDHQGSNLETAVDLARLGDTEEILLRAMRPDDLPQVALLEAQSQLDPWPQPSFRAELENSRVSQPLVAVRDDEIVGYIVPWFIEDEAQIATIAVKENHPRRGLGLRGGSLRRRLRCARQRRRRADGRDPAGSAGRRDGARDRRLRAA